MFNDRSFILFDNFGWTLADLEVFELPIAEWNTSDKYNEIITVIEGLSVVNDCAERLGLLYTTNTVLCFITTIHCSVV